MINQIRQYNVRETPWAMEDNSVDCCITSPPYWGLRDYGNPQQLGLESTPEEYVANMVNVFEQVRRVLKPQGTLWLNLGDSYFGGGSSTTNGNDFVNWAHKSTMQGTHPGGSKRPIKSKVHLTLKPKDLVGIPWMVAFALRSAGWYLRQDIIWNKPNPMPESVTDRCTKAHEYIFMLTKSAKYYYDHDAIKTPAIPHSLNPTHFSDGSKKEVMIRQRGHGRQHNGFNDRWDNMTTEQQMSLGANKRSVWTVPTKPFKEAHFATFPPELIEPCVLAGCPPGSLVFDPFMGAGTTALVAAKLQRNYTGFELNPAYISIAENRLKTELGMFYGHEHK
jgi:DNA modification methylase